MLNSSHLNSRQLNDTGLPIDVLGEVNLSVLKEDRQELGIDLLAAD
jgi:hypothetical protein